MQARNRPLFAAVGAASVSSDSLVVLGESGDPVPDRARLSQIQVDLVWDGKGGSGPLSWVLTSDAEGDRLIWSGETDATDALTSGDLASAQLVLGDDGIAWPGSGGLLYLWLSLASGAADATATLIGEQR